MYVSFSGGKDSTVLLDIVKGMYPDVPAVFIDTGLEYPEVRRFAIERADVVLRPEMRFDQVIKACGYPVVSKEVAQVVREARKGLAKGDGSYAFRIAKLRGELKDKDGNLSIYNIPQWGKLLNADFDISEQCCTIMKKQPAIQYEKATGRKPFIGTMADESFLRRNRWMRHGCNAFEGKHPTSNPLSFLATAGHFEVYQAARPGDSRRVRRDRRMRSATGANEHVPGSVREAHDNRRQPHGMRVLRVWCAV